MNPTTRCNEICNKFLDIHKMENYHRNLIFSYDLQAENNRDISELIKFTEEGEIVKEDVFCPIPKDKMIELEEGFYFSFIGSTKRGWIQFYDGFDQVTRRIGKVVLNYRKVFDHEITEKTVSGKEFYNLFDSMKCELGDIDFTNVYKLLKLERFTSFCTAPIMETLKKTMYLLEENKFNQTLCSHVDRVCLKILKENDKIHASTYEIRDFKFQKLVKEELWEQVGDTKYYVFKIDLTFPFGQNVINSRNTIVEHSVTLFDDFYKARDFVNISVDGVSDKNFAHLKKNKDTDIRFKFY